MFENVSITTKAILVFVLIAALAALIPPIHVPEDINALLQATAIFYSILLGFYISSAMANLTRLKTLIAMETGALMAIYHQVKLALPDRLDQMRESIDRYLLRRFDYEIDEYIDPTNELFFGIFDVLKGAEPKSSGEMAAMTYIAEAEYYTAQARREIDIVSAGIMNQESWVVLIPLSLIIVMLLFLLRDGSLVSALVTIFLSSSAVLALFILDNMDGNRFGEEEFAIEAFQAVFIAIGTLPYYPGHYIRSHRYTPDEKSYRTGNSRNVRVIGHGLKNEEDDTIPAP